MLERKRSCQVKTTRSTLLILRNYGAANITSPDPLPSIYPRAIATSSSSATWNFTTWTPDALVVNLGTNDFSTDPKPDQTTFTDGTFSIDF